MNLTVRVAVTAVVVNAAAMALCWADGDFKTFAIAYAGAACAGFGAVFFAEEEAVARKITHRTIAMRIRWEIKTDKLPHGHRLPSQREYAERLGTTRTTVARAFELLESEKLIQVIHGLGTFVRDPRAPRDEQRFTLVEQTLRDSAERYEEIGSPEGIAEDLQVSVSTVRRGLRKLVLHGLLRRRSDGIYIRA